MPRICVVTQDPALGGGVRSKLLEFLRFAAARGHRCDLFYPIEGPATAPAEAALRAHPAVGRLCGVPTGGHVPHHLRASRFARRLPLGAGYDAHHVISGSLLHALPLARAGRPFVASIACTYGAEVRGLAARSLRHRLLYNPLALALARRQEIACAQRAARILVDSRCSAREVRAQLGVPADRIDVVPAPVDTAGFRPGPARRAPRTAGGTGLRRVILSVGRLDRRKDHVTLLEAFAAAVATRRASGDDLELRIIGEGKERSRIERCIATLGLGGRVHLLGHVDREELQAQYRGAGLFALASRQEGIGIVLLEALASGLPVVATAAGGVADAVEDGVTGLLVPVGRPGELAAAMLTILADAGLAARMGRTARRKATRDFAREVIDRKLDAVYREVFGLIPPTRARHAA